MAAAALITLREGLEAALILGIVLGYLNRIGHPDGARYVWSGVFGAVIASLGVAAGIQSIGLELEGTAEQIFEGATMILAVVVLTWMIFWMRYQARVIKTTLETDVQAAIETGSNKVLAALAFLAVFREGVETALFLSAASFASDGAGTLTGALIGLGLAAILGFLLYASSARLNLRLFFNVTSVLLLLFAAGLLAHGVHEFQEAGVISTAKAEVWDTNNVLDERSPAGELLKALFGYNGNPSIEEVAAYILYWVATLFGLRWWLEFKLAPKLENA